MPYPQDLVGRFIAYRMNPGGTSAQAQWAASALNGVLTGQVTDSSVRVFTYHAARAAKGRAPSVPAGWVDTNTNWSFSFLKYVPGVVTVASRQKPVLTGPMSGCFLFKYANGGPEMVAHVGTANADDSVDTVAAKNSWRNFAALPHVANIGGASPYGVFQFHEIASAMLAPGHIPMIAGYFDRTGPGAGAYSIILSPVPGSMKPPMTPMLKVSAVRTMPLQSWNTIRNLPAWR